MSFGVVHNFLSYCSSAVQVLLHGVVHLSICILNSGPLFMSFSLVHNYPNYSSSAVTLCCTYIYIYRILGWHLCPLELFTIISATVQVLLHCVVHLSVYILNSGQPSMSFGGAHCYVSYCSMLLRCIVHLRIYELNSGLLFMSFSAVPNYLHYCLIAITWCCTFKYSHMNSVLPLNGLYPLVILATVQCSYIVSCIVPLSSTQFIGYSLVHICINSYSASHDN